MLQDVNDTNKEAPIILNSDHQFQEKVFKVFVIVISHAPHDAMFLTDQISFSCSCRGSPKEHSCEVWLELVQWYILGRVVI